MPCRDYYDDHPDQFFKDVTEPALKKQISFAESALCQVLAALEHVDSLVPAVSPKTGEWYDWINFKEAGITKKELVAWHRNHKKIDEKLRTEQKEKKLRESALAKLTEQEKIVLGLK